jgi:hypothetical protein
MLYSLRKFFIIGSLTKNVISDWLFVIYDWHRLLHAVLMFLDIPTLRTMGNQGLPRFPTGTQNALPGSSRAYLVLGTKRIHEQELKHGPASIKI